MDTQVFTGMAFFADIPGNVAIARTSTGVTPGVSPTNQLFVPVATSGTYTTSAATMTGSGGSTPDTDFAVNDYVYYNGLFVGQITAINAGTKVVTFAATVTNTFTAGAVFGVKYLLFDGKASILRRTTAVVVSPTQVKVPSSVGQRTGSGAAGDYANTAYISWNVVSPVGNPAVEAGTAIPIPCTVESLNIPAPVGTSQPPSNWYPTAATLPQFQWERINPYGPGTEAIPANSRWVLDCNQSLPCDTLSVNMPNPAVASS